MKWIAEGGAIFTALRSVVFHLFPVHRPVRVFVPLVRNRHEPNLSRRRRLPIPRHPLQ